MRDINGNLVNVDVKASSYPIREVSKSKLQGKVGEYLQELFPYEVILEEFFVPGSRLSVDFFVPKQRLVIEIQGAHHDSWTPHFHQSHMEGNFAKQVSHDVKKAAWCSINGFRLVEIRSEEDMKQI